MGKLRHLAIAAQDPDATAKVYMELFDFEFVRTTRREWGYGHILTDGTLNLAILKFTSEAAAGAERGSSFTGLHHLGFVVEDIDATAARVKEAGGHSRRDIDAGLGIPSDRPVHGEVKFELDGVVFDLAEEGFWKLVPAEAEFVPVGDT